MSPSPWSLVAASALVGVSAIGVARSVFGSSTVFSGSVAPAATGSGDYPVRLRLVGLLFAVACINATPWHHLWLPALTLALLVGFAQVPWRPLCAALAGLLPFVGLAAAGLLLAGDWPRFLTVASRAALCSAALAVLAATTAWPDLLAGAQALRLPSVLVSLLGMSLRYLDLLVSEGHRMGLAFTARAVGRRDLRLARPLGRVVGSLAVRTIERAERVHLAMAARGFEGLLHYRPRPERWHSRAVCFWLLCAAPLLAGACWR